MCPRAWLASVLSGLRSDLGLCILAPNGRRLFDLTIILSHKKLRYYFAESQTIYLLPKKRDMRKTNQLFFSNFAGVNLLDTALLEGNVEQQKLK